MRTEELLRVTWPGGQSAQKRRNSLEITVERIVNQARAWYDDYDQALAEEDFLRLDELFQELNQRSVVCQTNMLYSAATFDDGSVIIFEDDGSGGGPNCIEVFASQREATATLKQKPSM